MPSGHEDDIAAIHLLKARYFRTMDTKDWDGYLALFTSDITVTVDAEVSTRGRDGKPQPTLHNAVEFVERTKMFIDDCTTVHHGHMPEIELTSPTTAKGIWAMEDIVEWPDGKLLRGYGHYHETYRKEADGWRIASLHLTRLRVDLTGPWEGHDLW